MIVGAELVSFELPFRAPVLAGEGILESRAGLLLGLLAEDGSKGWGEASPLPGWSSDSLPAVEAALAGLCSSLRDRPRVAAALAATAVAWLARLPSASSALDQALLDLAATSAGVSLAEHLSGAAAPPSVPVNALIGGETPDEVASRAAAAVGEGFETFKLKIGDGSPPSDLERVRALRDAVGSHGAIRLDAGGRWDHQTAIEMLRALAPIGIEYIEDPVADLDALAQLAVATDVPVAVDALLARSANPLEVVAAAAAGTYIIKPQPLGGPGPATRLARAIRESGAAAVVTGFMDSAVGLTGALHVAAAVAPDTAAGLGTSYLFRSNVAPPPTIVSGRAIVPRGPGLGVAPVPEFGK